MIRFLLPVLLLAFGACQVPNQGNNATASPASLEDSKDCSGADCSSEATAAATSECTEGQSECSEDAAAEATAVAMLVEVEGGCCEEKATAAATAAAAANTECSELSTKECPIEKAKAEAAVAASLAVQASLVVGEGCCEGKTVADACGGCAEKAIAAPMKQCEGKDPAECETIKAAGEAKSECSSEEAPASVKTGATQASAVKAEESSCCSSKSAEPSN
ncbi:MAG: hypothetical protein O3A95_08625 [Planctomycetota bacterium]|nr:hypothetical protein [Planctomycetota bacterium]MDA1114346.1 hypothetical protein [Planctomycetota bacterium]